MEKPILIKKPIDGKNDIFRYGANEIQGWKKIMEVFNIKENIIDPEKNINIFGIFEGHSGNEISQYLSTNFSHELLQNNNFIKGDYKQALIDTFKNMDISLKTEEVNNQLLIYSQKNKMEKNKKINEIYQTIDNENNLNENDINEINTFMEIIDPNNLEGILIADYVGSSGLVILIDNKITYIANAGNSHYIAISKSLTIINDKNMFKQNIYNKNEKKRIKIAKGIKYGKEKEYSYHNEEYLYTRGFGDFQYKNNHLINIDEQEISPIPNIVEIDNKELKFLIICNSGFFETGRQFNNSINDSDKNIEKNIAEYFYKELQNKQRNISDIIGDYCDEFLLNENNKNTNNNNLSCIVIEFYND